MVGLGFRKCTHCGLHSRKPWGQQLIKTLVSGKEGGGEGEAVSKGGGEEVVQGERVTKRML